MELIEDNPRWKELREKMEELSANKCWYTEASEKVSHYDVDHFRPKGSIRKYKTTENSKDGYWWLAYKPDNYRLSGIIPNRPHKDKKDGITKGKHNYFPLKNGSKIALSDKDDENDEENYLLDPTNDFDITLLTFDKTGSAIPSYPKDTWEYERAFVSRELYNLDFYKLKKARKIVWDKCERKINEIQNDIQKSWGKNSATLKATIIAKIQEIKEMVKKESEFSSVAISCLLKSNLYGAVGLMAN
jgi:hypothetical protein